MQALLSGSSNLILFLVGIDDDAEAMAAVVGRGFIDPKIIGRLDADDACRKWVLCGTLFLVTPSPDVDWREAASSTL